VAYDNMKPTYSPPVPQHSRGGTCRLDLVSARNVGRDLHSQYTHVFWEPTFPSSQITVTIVYVRRWLPAIQGGGIALQSLYLWIHM